MNVNADRRKYERVSFDCEILYPVVITDDVKKTYKDQHHLYALDISETGICLESNFSIPLDSFVSFYFRIEDNLPFKCLVKIKWGKNQDSKFIYGGEFIALNLEDIEIMRKYVTSHKQSF
jgi:hypothetical protein